MKTPEIDMDEMKKFKEENFKERLRFIKFYADWMKKKSNKEWSSQQKDIIGKP